MATFLLKVNCKLHLNGAEPRPTEASQWEGQTITCPVPRKLGGGGAADQLRPGDTLIIWTHEDIEFGNGQGLTATATAGAVVNHAETADAVMLEVELVKPHTRLNSLSDGPTGSILLDSLRKNRLRRTIWVSELQVSEFWEALRVVDRTKHALIAAHSAALPKSEVEQALEHDQQNIVEGFQRRFTSVEVRPEQAAFRRLLMQAYGGRCVISRSQVSAVLQAAHIIPFSENIELRNEVSNGLLLRADLHILFDKSLIAIHPATNKVAIAGELRGTVYEQFADRVARHQARPEFLRRQHQEFLIRSRL